MLDYGLLVGLVTASTVAGIGVAKYLGVRSNGNNSNKGNGYITREKADEVFQSKDVCDARFQSLTGWMKRIDSKLDMLLREKYDRG